MARRPRCSQEAQCLQLGGVHLQEARLYTQRGYVIGDVLVHPTALRKSPLGSFVASMKAGGTAWRRKAPGQEDVSQQFWEKRLQSCEHRGALVGSSGEKTNCLRNQPLQTGPRRLPQQSLQEPPEQNPGQHHQPCHQLTPPKGLRKQLM